MRRVTITAPFTDGLVTDVPAHLLGPRMCTVARNMIIVDGIATRRRGFELGVGNSLVLSPIIGLAIVEFALSDRLATLVFTKDGGYVSDPLSMLGGDFKFLGSTTSTTNIIDYDALPRCVYNDEVIICDQAGQRGIRRYAGAGWATGSANSFEYEWRQRVGAVDGNPVTISMNTTAGSREFSYTLPGTNSASIQDLATLTFSQPGWYVNWNSVAGPAWGSKIANVYSTSKGTLLNAVSAGSWSTQNARVNMIGVAFPAVSVYSAGSITSSSGTVTGVGVEWENGDWGKVSNEPSNNDRDPKSILAISGGTAYLRNIAAVNSNTSLEAPFLPDISTPAQYHIVASLPFADATVHRGSLCGTGVAQYPNRVYIAPPGWDMESPPGSVPPLRLESASFQNPDPDYFLLDFIDVPSTVDTDPVVAILSSPGPLLVIKQDAVYGIYGDFPNFTQGLIAKGAGCIDRRSAFSCRYGQFWAGAEGIYRYTPDTGPVDITQGRINNEWRSLMRVLNGDSLFCCMGEANGKLVVSVGNDYFEYVLVHDIESGAWDGYQDIPAFVACVTVRGREYSDVDEFYFVAAPDPGAGPPPGSGDARAKVVYAAGRMLAGSSEASPIDYGASRPPRMVVSTGTGLGRSEGIDGLVRVVDVSLSATVLGRDAGVTPTVSTFTTVAVDVGVEGGVLGSEAPATPMSLAAISEAGASVGLVRRRRERVGWRGRLSQLTVRAESLDDNIGLYTEWRNGAQLYPYGVAIHQLSVSHREGRQRS